MQGSQPEAGLCLISLVVCSQVGVQFFHSRLQITELHLKHPQPEAHFRDVGSSTRFQVISISTKCGFRLLALLVEQAQPIIRIGGVLRLGSLEVGIEFADAGFAIPGLLKEHSPAVMCQAPELLAPQFQVGLVVLRGSP